MPGTFTFHHGPCCKHKYMSCQSYLIKYPARHELLFTKCVCSHTTVVDTMIDSIQQHTEKIDV